MIGKHRMRPILLATAIAAALFAVALDASAKTKKTTMRIPRDAKVEIQSTTQLRMNNNGETGTFDCRCSGANHSGTCILGRGSSTIICGIGGSTCAGTCKLFTTTGGLSGGVMMKKQ